MKTIAATLFCILKKSVVLGYVTFKVFNVKKKRFFQWL